MKRSGKIDVLSYESGSPYPDEEIGFNWLNYSYPLVHSHMHWEIVLVTHGKILHSIDGEKVTMSRGDLCLVRPDDYHSLLFPDKDTKGTHLSILVKTSYMQRVLSAYKDSLYEELTAQKGPWWLSLSDLETQKVINQILDIRSTKMPLPEKIFRLKCIVNRLLNAIIDQHAFHQKLPDWLTEFLFVLSNPHLKENDVKSLAGYTPYSYSRLAPLFKSLTGRTIVEYVTTIKMQYAEGLLKTTDTPITQIALELSYESLSHFIRTFKRTFGVTPSKYRKDHME